MIAEEGKVQSSECCKLVALNLGGYNCSVNLYALPLGGCDVALGVHRLSIVSLVLWHFQLLTIKIVKDARHQSGGE